MNEVIGRIISELIAGGVKVSFNTPKSKRDKQKKHSCEGSYINGEHKALSVKTSNPNWVPTLVHEYSHFKQDQEGLWASEDECELWNVWREWLAGKPRVRKSTVENACRAIQACELDCEKRTVRFMKANNLPFDVDKYIRIANVYILSYEASRILRNDFTKFHPVEVPEIFNLMPAKFLKDYTKLPDGMLDLIKKHCL